MLFLHNLSTEPSTVDLSSLRGEAEELNQVFADQDYEPLDGLKDLALTGYGYRWIRLRRSAAA
jgi:maltose alpha-D-glucosyltransferase/alpha-amylase